MIAKPRRLDRWLARPKIHETPSPGLVCAWNRLNILAYRLISNCGLLQQKRVKLVNVTFTSRLVNPVWLARLSIYIIPPAQTNQKSTGHIFHYPKVGGETEKNHHKACDKWCRKNLCNKKGIRVWSVRALYLLPRQTSKWTMPQFENQRERRKWSDVRPWPLLPSRIQSDPFLEIGCVIYPHLNTQNDEHSFK